MPPVSHRPPLFRTRMSAAPLKPATPIAGTSTAPLFRTRMSAAPLKRAVGRDEGDGRGRIPHSNECGPIEAFNEFARELRSLIIPHSNECGPIEAGSNRALKGCRKNSNECGPIEAKQDRVESSLHQDVFRTRMSAAPLKPQEGCDGRGDAGGDIPHSNECGPIEAIK